MTAPVEPLPEKPIPVQPVAAQPIPLVQLVLQYASGRTERVPLEQGVWKVGSSPWSCDIVLEEPSVEPLHGLLVVRGGIVSFEDHSAPIAADDGAPRAQVVLEPGDSLSIGSVRLTIGSHYTWPSQQRLDSPSGTAQLRSYGEVGLSLGTLGYPRFQRILADEISPGEAADARARFRTSLWAFTYLLLGWLALVAVRWFLPPVGVAPAWHADLCSAAGIVVALVAVSYCGLPFAGQLMLPLATLFWSASIPSVDWITTANTTIGKLILVLPFNWLLGWAIDCGASTDPSRSWKEARRWLLVFAALILAISYGVEWRMSQIDEGAFEVRTRWLSLAATAVLALWGWIALPWIESARSLPGLDVQTVLDAGYIRWGRLVLGQVLAILAGLMPLVMFLSSLGMTERLAWPEDSPNAATNPPVISHRSSGEPVAWFWASRGHFLHEQDLKLGDAKIYAYHTADFDEATNRSITEALEQIGKKESGPAADAAYARLEKWLAPHRATNVKDLGRFLSEQYGWKEVAKYRPGKVLHLESQQTTAVNREGAPRVIYYADSITLKDVEKSDPARSTIGAIANYFYLAFAVIGFTMLWRRGGESPLARWLGFLLIGFSGLLLIGPSSGLITSMEYELWHDSLQSGALSSLKITAFSLLNAVAMLLSVAVFFAVPFSVVWVELCWPSTRPEEERGLADWVLMVAKMIGVTIAYYLLLLVISIGLMFGLMLMNLIIYGPNETPEPEPEMAMIVAAILAVLFFILIGAWMRRSTAIHSEVPQLGWKPLTMMGSGVASLILLLLWQQIPWEAQWQSNLCVAAGMALVAVFVATAISSMLADNFLRLSEARDLSAILATAVLPFALEATEKLVDVVFRDFHLLLHSEHGSSVLSILLVVMVMVPFHAWMEKVLKWWSIGPVAALAGEVEQLLEELPHMNEKERRARVDAFFERWEISTFAFYARTEGNRFEPVVGHHEGKLPTLPLSAKLLEFLQDRPHFCDLEHIPFEWLYYFQQFELYRLQQASGGRYLLPLVLGPTVRGLLILPDTPAAEVLARDAIAEELAPLGLEIVCRGETQRGEGPSPSRETEQIETVNMQEEALLADTLPLNDESRNPKPELAEGEVEVVRVEER